LSPEAIVPAILAEAAKSPIRVHRLRGGIAVLEGSGGNVAVLQGQEGKLLVDAGIAVSRPQLETALNSLGDEPVTRLINTHWHFDHADGNAWLHKAGARITAHANTRKRLSEAQRVEDWNYDFPAPPVGALPSDVFTTEKTITHGGVTIGLRYYGPAHTDSDIAVHFRDVDILHTGDTYWNGAYPMIDYSSGGHIDGAIAAAETNLQTTTESTIVIPGHGRPVSDRAGLQAFRDMLVGVRANVVALKRQGRSLEAITAARPTAAWDAHWGNFVISPALFTRLVYEGV
jgi:glyoxylase-like metal-dependent hydrolase (beta-lactamase superfamily II)